VSQLPSNGADVDVDTVVNEPPLVGRTSYFTDATPEPPSAAEDESWTFGPPTVAPDAGAVSEPVGGVLSTRTFDRTALVPVLPLPSVATTRRS
jgi:hypothetical protein